MFLLLLRTGGIYLDIVPMLPDLEQSNLVDLLLCDVQVELIVQVGVRAAQLASETPGQSGCLDVGSSLLSLLSSAGPPVRDVLLGLQVSGGR